MKLTEQPSVAPKEVVRMVQNTARRKWSVLVPEQVYLIIGVGEAMSGDARAEMALFGKECLSLLNTSQANQVHFINDLRAVTGIPSLGSVRSMQYLHHARLGYYVTLGVIQNPLLRFTAGMLSNMARLRFKDVQSIKEACELLMLKDITLPPLNRWNLALSTREL